MSETAYAKQHPKILPELTITKEQIQEEEARQRYQEEMNYLTGYARSLLENKSLCPWEENNIPCAGLGFCDYILTKCELKKENEKH